MKIISLILGTCALAAFPLHSAGAGQCTSEINKMDKVLAATDAGSGATPGMAGSNMGQHPPTIAMNQADQSTAASRMAANSGQPQHPPTAIMNRETTGMSSSSPSSERPKEEHPPTAAMNRETDGSATSAEDVLGQTQGQPSAALTPRADIAQSHSLVGAMAALERARLFDQQGKETDCLSSIGEAKLMIGLP